MFRKLRAALRCAVGATVLLAMASGELSAQVTTIEGQTADGALYAFAVPPQWNGRLVVYVHGIVDPGAPVAVPTAHGIRRGSVHRLP